MKPEEAIWHYMALKEDYLSRKSFISREKIDEISKEVIRMLEKQVAKKVENIRLSSDYELAENSVKEGECPECGETMTGNVFGLYCGVCGQLLDWRYDE